MQRWWRMATAAAVGVSLAVLGCSGLILLDINNVPAGTWGGDRATLVVGPASTIQLDCAHGRLDSPIRVDRNGRFDVAGVFVREHGGPIQAGVPEDRHAARYFGRLADGQLTLFISISDLDLQLGPFLLVLGGTSHLVRCL